MTSLALTLLVVCTPVVALIVGVVCSCMTHDVPRIIGWLLVAMSLSVWLFETVALFVFTSGVGAAPLITFWLLVFG
mgnify:CR=1 FL=1